MSQATKMFGAIFVAFVIYITMRNQLPKYLSLFSKSETSPNVSETVEPVKSNNEFDQLNDILNKFNMGLG